MFLIILAKSVEIVCTGLMIMFMLSFFIEIKNRGVNINYYYLWWANFYVAIACVASLIIYILKHNHDIVSEGLDIANLIVALYFMIKNKHNRKRQKKLHELIGEKTKAIIDSMTKKLTPSPIPSPSNS